MALTLDRSDVACEQGNARHWGKGPESLDTPERSKVFSVSLTTQRPNSESVRR